MAKLPVQKKILKEDLKGAPNWVDGLIIPLNSFMETVYQTLNKNITVDNLAGFYQVLTYKTPSTYPTMDNVTFVNTLKIRANNVQIAQIYEKSTYTPPVGPCYVPWIENNGEIVIYPITGLQADKTYIVKLLIT